MAENCPPGTYSPETTDPSASYNCLPCPLNYFCPKWGMNANDVNWASGSPSADYRCPAGYECLSGAIHQSNVDDVTMRLCPVGYRCDFATDGVASQACGLGYYNPRQGQAACAPCIAGFTCSEQGLEYPLPCPRGSYCVDLASVAYDVSLQTVPCPAGTYSSEEYLTAEAQCQDCPPGKYCEIGASTFTGLCSEGYICTGG